MKKNGKNKKSGGMLPIIIIIVLIIVIIIVTVKVSKKGNNKVANNEQQGIAATNEEFVQSLEDGTKLNNSSKMSETKTIDGMEISDIQVTEKDGVTLLLANVTNKSNSDKGDYAVALTILDKDGNTITVAHGYIKKLAAGETTQLSISKTFDYANAYDYTIAKE